MMNLKNPKKNPKASIIMGSLSDLPVMKEAIDLLESFHVPTEVKIVSAHRSPRFMQNYALQAEKRGFKVIIAGAGGAAHLPGMVASLTNLPVIGVPIQVGKLEGLDALLSVVQMPKGAPVATVAVDNSWNAGFLCLKILSLSQKNLKKKLDLLKKTQRTKVQAMNKELLKKMKK